MIGWVVAIFSFVARDAGYACPLDVRFLGMRFRSWDSSSMGSPSTSTRRLPRARIVRSIPDPVRTHWVEFDGRRWRGKQAFEVAAGKSRDAYISQTAVRLLGSVWGLITIDGVVGV
jgi:hypothetical protein